MLVSVILPVFNGERYLAEAIASIRRQPHSPLEIIVIDDGSTDGTAFLLERLGPDIQVVHQSNQGPAVARNRGLELATGDVIAFLDADDFWPHDKLQLQLPVLEAIPSVQIVMGKVQRLQPVHQENGRPVFQPSSPPWQELLLGCTVCRRSVFDRIGGFDPVLRTGEDTDWFLRTRSASVSTAVLEQVTLFYRRHPHSLTWGMDHRSTTIFPVLKRVLQRHRQPPDETGIE